MSRAVVAYVPDLMDRSKVAAAAPGARFVSRPDELAEGDADVVVLDLSKPGALDVLPLPGRVIGFCSHVDTATIEQAAVHGVEALPRSAFFRRLPDLLA